jgi:hypothetical protein
VKAAVLIVVAAATGCLRATTFQCQTDAQCTSGGVQGVCEANGFCSFPDPACMSGQRYGSLSGSAAGECVTPGGQSVQVTVGGTVGGLTGHGLVLRNNGGDDLAVAMNGAFTFASPIVTGDTYAVTVGAMPSNPSQACAVANAAGMAATSDITDVAVSCATATYTLGGSVLGLTGTGLVLTDGAEDLPISSTGMFTFTLPIASGAMYAVTVKTQPSTGPCSVVGGTGTVGTGNVTTIVVNCSSTAFTISGTISGLDGTVVLHDATAGTASVTSNGTWALPMLVPAAASYSVTVQTQPGYPPHTQTCVVAMGTGTISGDVSNVAVTCTTNTYTVGGMASGLSGTLVLQDNAGDDKTITASGAFTFATAVASGNLYAVTIKTQPAGQTCSLSSASGTVTTANITNVTVTCGSGGDPGILCGSAYCDPAAGQLCCVTSGVPACATSCTGGNTIPYKCDDEADCVAQGQPNNICCGALSGGIAVNVYCTKPSLCTSPKVYYCDPGVAGECPTGTTCLAASSPAGYHSCQ